MGIYKFVSGYGSDSLHSQELGAVIIRVSLCSARWFMLHLLKSGKYASRSQPEMREIPDKLDRFLNLKFDSLAYWESSSCLRHLADSSIWRLLLCANWSWHLVLVSWRSPPRQLYQHWLREHLLWNVERFWWSSWFSSSDIAQPAFVIRCCSTCKQSTSGI